MLLSVFLLFLLFYGSITLESVLFALVISLAVFGFCAAFLGHSLRKELLFYRLIPFFIGYFFLLLKEILLSALRVIGILFTHDRSDAGRYAEFSSGLENELPNILLSNSITLTPGTITVKNEGDRFLVHCLTDELARETESEMSAFLPMLRRLDRILQKEAKRK